jgi:hypothetical protein
MGKYVPDREFITGLEKELRDIIDKYNFEIHMFEQKNVKKKRQRSKKIVASIKNTIAKAYKRNH